MAVKVAKKGITVVPVLPPSFIMRSNRRMEGVALLAMERAAKLARGEWYPHWEDKNYTLHPTADEVVSTLRSMHGHEVAYDIETNGQHPLDCDVRCIGFYDGHRGICVPYLFRDGTTRLVTVEGQKKQKLVPIWTEFFKGPKKKRVLDAIEALIASKGTRFDTQNGQYDRQCEEARHGLIFPSATGVHFDTMLAHHLVASYMPHGLGFLASLYTEAPFYKATEEGDAWSSGTDEELWKYCVRDCVVTWLAAQKLRAEVQERKEDKFLYQHDAWQEQECQRWKKVGVLVNKRTLELYRMRYSTARDAAMAAMKKELEKQSGGKKLDPEGPLSKLLVKLQAKADAEVFTSDGTASTVEQFNPASLIQLRLLLRHLNIPLAAETATGQLSTAKEFLLTARKELMAQGLPPDAPALAFLDYLLAWRESAKLVGTYLDPEILDDGRVHPTFSVHVVPTGRLASKQPNFQNQPAELRGMYEAKPGHIFVYGDWDALEMRLGAYMSQDASFIADLKAYDAGTGPKIHIINAAAIFGLPLSKDFADKYPGCYRAAKVFAYAVAYGAGIQTVFEQVREEMPDMEFKDFQKCFENYKKFRHGLFQFQADVVKRGTQHQFLDSPVLGRRIYFFERVFGEDSPEASAMQNAPYQSGGADIVSLANRRVVDQLVIPWRKKLKPDESIEQLAQVHDELLFEVPERLAPDFAAEFKRIAELPCGDKFKTWNLPVDVKFKKTWKPVTYPCPTCKAPTVVKQVQEKEVHTKWAGDCERCATKSPGKGHFSFVVPHAGGYRRVSMAAS